MDQSGSAVTPLDGNLPPTTEDAIRLRAQSKGYCLVKFDEHGQWFLQYGPYGLKNEANLLEVYGLSLEEVADYLNKDTE